MPDYDARGQNSPTFRAAANLSPVEHSRIVVESLKSPLLKSDAARMVRLAEQRISEHRAAEQARLDQIRQQVKANLERRQTPKPNLVPGHSKGVTATARPLSRSDHKNIDARVDQFMTRFTARRHREVERAQHAAIAEPLKRLAEADRRRQDGLQPIAQQARPAFERSTANSLENKFNDRALGQPRRPDLGLGD